MSRQEVGEVGRSSGSLLVIQVGGRYPPMEGLAPRAGKSGFDRPDMVTGRSGGGG